MFLAFLCCSTCLGQTSFKGNSLGMSLEQFKQQNKGEQVWINTGDPTKRANKKLSKQVDTPFCTDTMDGFPGSDDGSSGHRSSGEVICNISPGTFNRDARMIGNHETLQVLYHFYNSKLYAVSLSFHTIEFDGMVEEFRAKFGEPTKTGPVECQNAFGAHWTGRVYDWNITQKIGAVLYEGCSNGPGQNKFDGYSNGSISDNAGGPPPPSLKKEPDF